MDCNTGHHLQPTTTFFAKHKHINPAIDIMRPLDTIPWCKGEDTCPQTGNEGLTPSGSTHWSVCVLAAHVCDKDEDRVQLPDGPLQLGLPADGGD
jgi:hypothetical protein